MKGIDWEAVLALLPRWEALSSGARETLLQIPLRGGPLSMAGEARAELEAAGFVNVQGTSFRLPEAVAPVMAAFQVLDRVPVLATPDASTLYGYVSLTISPGDVNRVVRGTAIGWSYPPPTQVAARAGSVARLEEFLGLDQPAAARRWAKANLSPEVLARFDASSLVAAVQRLVRALVERAAAVRLAEVAALLPDLQEREVATTLAAATHLLFVFPTVVEGGVLCVGAWPPLVRRLNRPAGPPPVVDAAESFDTPWLLGDMTAVLVEASAEPLRVRTDGALFVRAARAIAARLAPVPAWFPGLLWEESDEDDEDGNEPARKGNDDSLERVSLASGWLQLLGLLAHRSSRGAEPRLEPTPAGRKWLASSEHDRLAYLLDHLRKQKDRVPPGPYEASKGGIPFFPLRLGVDVPRGLTLDVRGPLTEAMLSLSADGFVDWEHFLDHHAREGNPFLPAEVRKALGRRMWNVSDTEEEWEVMWMELLDLFMSERMAPLGGVRLGRREDGGLAVGLTSVGRYLLGAADSFALDTVTEEGAVVVQPDFEVVFLAPAPRAEAEIGRFADRIGKGVGATFRVTRASTLRAAEAGTTEEEIVGVLRDAAGREPPANVARQVRDWLGAVRRVSIAPAVLIDCPDEETAARVLAAGGKEVDSLSPTVLRLADGSSKARSALVKKLRAAGIFLGG